jgi:hypothetical protein
MPFLIRCLTWALECAVREGYAFFNKKMHIYLII